MKKCNLEIFQKAVSLAHSGQHRDWKSIEKALVEAGHHRSPQLLDGDKVRAILNTLCEAVRPLVVSDRPPIAC